jgi:hypothetical protein
MIFIQITLSRFRPPLTNIQLLQEEVIPAAKRRRTRRIATYQLCSANSSRFVMEIKIMPYRFQLLPAGKNLGGRNRSAGAQSGDFSSHVHVDSGILPFRIFHQSTQLKWFHIRFSFWH